MKIFMPVSIFYKGTLRSPSSTNNKLFDVTSLISRSLPKTIQMNALHYQKLAQCLTESSSDTCLQVGRSFREAEDIINQHSHRYYQLIVEVNVPEAYFLADNAKEELLPAVDKANSDYLYLNKNYIFSASDILSVSPMEHYLNSIRFKQRISLHTDRFWPRDVANNYIKIKRKDSDISDLENYISNRQAEPTKLNHLFFFSFGFSKDSKIAAANALFTVLKGGSKDLLIPHEKTLNNGRLKFIYLNLKPYIFDEQYQELNADLGEKCNN